MGTCGSIRQACAHCAVLFAALYLLIPVFSSAQRHGSTASFPVRHKTTVLTIEGQIAKPLYLTLADFRSFPRSTIRTAQSPGETVLYEGVPLVELLRKAGAPIGGRNKEEMRTYVEAVSRDGSHVIFSLAELDPAFTDSNVLVADTLNGTPSPEAELLLVANGSGRAACCSTPHHNSRAKG
jgi:DMSO/TMAO reductase YedYZ molybdopterin-dependent catalytic subunit